MTRQGAVLLASPCLGRMRRRQGAIDAYGKFAGVVNKPVAVTVGAEVDSAAVRTLRSVTELSVTADPLLGPAGGALVGRSGEEVAVSLLHRARVTSAVAHQIVQEARPGDAPMVVTASEITATAREILAAAGVGSIDAQGNACLDLPGLVMRVITTRRPRRAPGPVRLSGKAGVVAQALLLAPDHWWRVTELAGVAGVSTGLTHRVLARLETEGVVAADGAGPRKTRRVRCPAALLDLWDEEHTDRPSRQTAFMLAQTSGDVITAVCDGLERCGVQHALTGAAAAYGIAPFVTNVLVVEAWIADSADPVEVCEMIGARPVDSGPNVVLLQERGDAALAFNEPRSGGGRRANLFRVYADLGRDPRRGVEQRNHLRCETIGF